MTELEKTLQAAVDNLDRKYRRVTWFLMSGLAIMAVAFTLAGLATMHGFNERIDEQRRLELHIFESARDAKMQTCVDLNQIRASIRGVLRERLADNTQAERDAALARFQDVDCERRVNRLFGKEPVTP